MALRRSTRTQYYNENLVIGDLPAGNYLLRTAYAGISHRLEIEIRPGLVTYFVFQGYQSFPVEAAARPRCLTRWARPRPSLDIPNICAKLYPIIPI